ncbi:MAG: hypothetical protein ACOX8O_02710 [Christensenellales bacterium]
MNDILALGGLSGLTGAPVSRTGGEGGSGALFGELLTSVLLQSALRRESDRPPSPADAAGFASDADGTALLLCMLMLNSNGGAGLTTALSSLMSAGREDTLTTARLGAAAAAYGSNAAASGDPQPAVTTYAGNAGTIPYESWKPANPAVTSAPGARGAANYRAVIDQFRVETNGRYKVNKQGRGDTYCNIFVWDVTSAMGAEIPHYVDAKTREPRAYPDTAGALCMTANMMGDWLETTGPAHGWRRVSAQEAQHYANSGSPAVAVWKNPGGHGHVQMVCPSANGAYDPQKGVTVAQAGRLLYNYAHITRVYSNRTLRNVAYYVHV